jgi:hypothetical protein
MQCEPALPIPPSRLPGCTESDCLVTAIGAARNAADNPLTQGFRRALAVNDADSYAWLYSEEMNWLTGDIFPEGIEDATRSAKDKHQAGLPHGFEIERMLLEAQDRTRARLVV